LGHYESLATKYWKINDERKRQMKTIEKLGYVRFAAFALVFFALPQMTQAVSPPPDGGYPGGNTAEGQSALFGLTTGAYNTAVGFLSLVSNSTGNFNTGTGAGALLTNTADNNTSIGAGALLSNTTGPANTATGSFALFSNTTGQNNTAIGFEALFSNTIGPFNTATGSSALLNNTTGDDNTADGAGALSTNSTGVGNVASGASALGSNTTGSFNTAVGELSLFSNTTGSANIAFGAGAGVNVTTASNVTCINAAGADIDNTCFIGNIFAVTTAIADAIPVMVDSAGQLGTFISSRRFKKEIQPMDKASEAILAFKPVTFHYKSDNTNSPQFGLIAEEVAEVNPNLVVRDKKGEILTVRYEAVNAMLLNEFLKEHRKVEEETCKILEQEATITELRKDLERVVVHAKKQDLEIQRVSALVNKDRSEPGMVAGGP
jgi:hypothetical protein